MVSSEPVPENVRRFVIQHVQSIAQLEILLLVSSSSERWWTVKEIYKALLNNEAMVQKTLDDFTHRRLVVKSDSETYQFSSLEEDRALMRSTAEIYRDRPGKIVQLIYETPASEIEEFARAFRIRKEP